MSDEQKPAEDVGAAGRALHVAAIRVAYAEVSCIGAVRAHGLDAYRDMKAEARRHIDLARTALAQAEALLGRLP